MTTTCICFETVCEVAGGSDTPWSESPCSGGALSGTGASHAPPSHARAPKSMMITEYPQCAHFATMYNRVSSTFHFDNSLQVCSICTYPFTLSNMQSTKSLKQKLYLVLQKTSGCTIFISHNSVRVQVYLIILLWQVFSRKSIVCTQMQKHLVSCSGQCNRSSSILPSAIRRIFTKMTVN